MSNGIMNTLNEDTNGIIDFFNADTGVKNAQDKKSGDKVRQFSALIDEYMKLTDFENAVFLALDEVNKK